MQRILAVDDDPEFLKALGRTLRRIGFVCDLAESADAAVRAIDAAPYDVVLTDLHMPGLDGYAVVRHAQQAAGDLPVVVMSGVATADEAAEAVRRGAFDFLDKPITLPRLEVTLHNALRHHRLHARASLADEVTARLVGNSPQMRRLRELIARIGPTDGRVLVLGESGTGKELVASALHAASLRAAGPYVRLNCSAVPADLVESELFGHRKGAFTSAVQHRRGKFELADGGTLFLDEVGDMPPAMQAKLLRVLQEGEFEPVGAEVTRKADVRVVAATHADLDDAIGAGRFREDLFYRLAVVTVRVPALRERRDDIATLMHHFLQEFRASVELSPGAVEVLAEHDWPGNIRELRNAAERVAILGSGVVGADELFELLRLGAARREPAAGLYRPGLPLKALVEEAERRILAEALAAHEGNRSATARALGLERSHLHKKLRRLGVGAD